MDREFKKKGSIQQIEENLIRVKIFQTSACSGCHARSVCSSLDVKEHIVEIKRDKTKTYHIGDPVIVCGQERWGLIAVWWAFFFPFLLLFISYVFLNLLIGYSELTAGLCALAILVPYYILLAMNRKRLGQLFSFTLEN